MARDPYGSDLYHGGNQFQTAGGAGDPRMPSGGSVNIGDLTGLVEVPLLDDRGVRAEGQAAAAIGQGLEQFSGNAVKLVEMQANAINTKRVTENERLMAATSAEIQKALLENPDETKWGDIVNEMIGKMPALPDDLSPVAREEIEARRASWQLSTQNTVMLKSAEKSVRDADSDLDAQRKLAIRNQNLPEANRIAEKQGQNGARSPAEIELLKQENVDGVERVQKQQRAIAVDAFKNETISIAQTHSPEEVRKWIDGDYAGHGLTPEEKEYLKDVAAGVARDQTAIIQEKFANGVADKSLWNDGALEAAFHGSPFMTPALMKQMQTELARFKNFDARKAKEGPEGMNNFVRLYRDAMEWKPVPGSEDAARELVNKITQAKMLVPDDYVGEVTSVLHSKFGSTASGDKLVRPEIQRQVSKSVTDHFAQAIAPWAAETARLTQIAKDSKAKEGSPAHNAAKEAQKVELIKRRESYAAQAGIEKQMRTWYQANPDKANDEQAVLKQLNEVLPDGTLLYHMDMINRAPDASGATPGAEPPDYGVDGDASPLPDNPGPIDNPLVPFRDPEPEPIQED